MRDQLTQRLQQLNEEYDKGQKQLAEVEAQATNIRNTMMRISGAIQVLDEELNKDAGKSEDEIKGFGEDITIARNNSPLKKLGDKVVKLGSPA